MVRAGKPRAGICRCTDREAAWQMLRHARKRAVASSIASSLLRSMSNKSNLTCCFELRNTNQSVDVWLDILATQIWQIELGHDASLSMVVVQGINVLFEHV